MHVLFTVHWVHINCPFSPLLPSPIERVLGCVGEAGEARESCGGGGGGELCMGAVSQHCGESDTGGVHVGGAVLEKLWVSYVSFMSHRSVQYVTLRHVSVIVLLRLFL